MSEPLKARVIKDRSIEELKRRLEAIPGSYYDFVGGISQYAGKKPERLEAVHRYLDEHPTSSTSDVVYFVSSQDDFYEDSAAQDFHRAKVVKALDDYLLRILFDNGEIRIYDCKPLLQDRLFVKLKDTEFFQTVQIDDMGVVGWNDAMDVNPYSLYDDSAPINEEADENHKVMLCSEPDKPLSENEIRIQIHITNSVVKTCVVSVVKEEEWFVATDEETTVTSQGKTIEEALVNIKEALELYYSE